MIFLRRILVEAARRLAADPRVQEKAAQVIDQEIKPRLQAVAARAKPTVDAARADIREAAREADPRGDPVGFVKQLKKRFIDDPR